MRRLIFTTVLSVLLLGCNKPDSPAASPGITASQIATDSASANQSGDKAFLESLKHRSGAEVTESTIRIYPFKKAMFTFDIKGMDIREGTLVMVVNEFGHFESKKSEKVDIKGQKIALWTIKRGLDLWQIDPEKHEATLAIMKTRQAAGIDINAVTASQGSREAADKYLQDNKIDILPDDIVGGYTCQVIRQDMGPYAIIRWVYQGVELRMAVVFPGKEPKITRELISVDFDAEIPEGIFEIPDDCAVQTTLSVNRD